MSSQKHSGRLFFQSVIRRHLYCIMEKQTTKCADERKKSKMPRWLVRIAPLVFLVLASWAQSNVLQQQLPQLNEYIPRITAASHEDYIYGPTHRRIAYAVSITDCPDKTEHRHLISDASAVLAHSIHRNSRRHPDSGSMYDYKLLAFVHPDAAKCTKYLPRYNYTVKVMETPINVSLIKREEYRERVQNPGAGCCREKEFLKLYALTLEEHEIVVHLDLDTLLLKPLDKVFDAMIQPDSFKKRIGPNAMWHWEQTVSRRIEAFFTRDYPMGNNGWPIEHYGVQGGFWIVRPNAAAFEELKHIIHEGNFSRGWYDDRVKFHGFYGAAMIQGLLGFYYGHVRRGEAIELNRCRFNNMADNPMKHGDCAVPLFHGYECEDCRKTNFSQIHSFHATFCGKPWNCAMQSQDEMCKKFFSAWFQTRYLFETSTYAPSQKFSLDIANPKRLKFDDYGFCRKGRYVPMANNMSVSLS